MSETSPEQFASAVTATIAAVHHLFREVDRLVAGLKEALAESPDPLVPVQGTIASSAVTPRRVVVRNEYGILFRPRSDEEDEEEDDLEEPEDDGGEGKRRGGPAEIVAEQPLLAVRIFIHDPQQTEGFEPVIRFAVMSEWAVGSPTKPGPGERYLLARYMLKRIPRALAPGGGEAGKRVVTRAAVKGGAGRKGGTKTNRVLSARLPCGVESEPLYSLDGADALGHLAKRMKTMWAKAVSEPQGT